MTQNDTVRVDEHGHVLIADYARAHEQIIECAQVAYPDTVSPQ